MVLMNLFAEHQWRCRHREQICGNSLVGRKGRDEWREWHGNIYITWKYILYVKWIASGNLLCGTGHSICDKQPIGAGWSGRWEGGSRGTGQM